MKKRYIEKVREMILKYFRNEPVKVFIFGSRALGTAGVGSDVDIGIQAKRGVSVEKLKLAKLREELEESTIPYKIDVVDMNDTSAEFRREAKKKIIYLKK